MAVNEAYIHHWGINTVVSPSLLPVLVDRWTSLIFLNAVLLAYFVYNDAFYVMMMIHFSNIGSCRIGQEPVSSDLLSVSRPQSLDLDVRRKILPTDIGASMNPRDSTGKVEDQQRTACNDIEGDSLAPQ
jgi:hypothetical protein